MVQFIPPRVRIVLVIITAFFISSILMSYSVGETETGVPQIQMQSIAVDLADSISDSKTAILASISSIQLPSLSSNTQQPEVNISTEATPIPTQPVQEWEIVPTVPTGPPTSTPYQAPSPTKKVTQPQQLYPTVKRVSPTQFIPPTIPPPQPTKIPKPTKTPKPTKVPEAPPVTSDVRPGESIEEILREVASRMCIPYALLMAERTIESGAWFKNMNAQTTSFYNTYGWWTKASHAQICSGLAYYTQTGIIPPDSAQAGTELCSHAPFGGGTTDQKIMGLFQVSEWEQGKALPSIKNVLPGKVDRRVLFDNAIIFASITKSRAGQSPKTSCDDWPQETVMLIAEKHYGACKYSGGNYCTEVWEMYKSFK